MASHGQKDDDPHWSLFQVSRLLKLFITIVLAVIATILGLGFGVAQLAKDVRTDSATQARADSLLTESLVTLTLAHDRQSAAFIDEQLRARQLEQRLVASEGRLRRTVRRVVKLQARLDSLTTPAVASIP